MATHAALAASRIPTSARLRLHSKAASKQRVDFADFSGLRPGSCSVSAAAREASFSDVLGAQLVARLVLSDVGVEGLTSFADSTPAGSTGDGIARLPLTHLTTLRVVNCDKLTSLDQFLSPEYLPSIKSIDISKCPCLRYLPIHFPSLEQLVLSWVGIEGLTSFADSTPAGSTGDGSSSSSNGIARLPLTRLTTLRLHNCRKLTNLDQFLSPEYLPSIKSIDIGWWHSLVSLPVHKFVGFVCLQDLKIQWCQKLVCPREMVLPPSLRRLSICGCGELDKSFPGCLENLTSLTLLDLTACNNVESIPLSSIHTSKLQCLLLRGCSELSSIGGLHALSPIQHVEISGCTKLTEIQQPFEKKGLWPMEEELRKFAKSF